MIQPRDPSHCSFDAQEYLELLQGLAQEINQAMEAIVTNTLPSLESSILRQKASCARLVDISSVPMANRILSQDGKSALVDRELALRIREAASTLNELNSRYSALLKHSGDTMRLVSTLFQSYTGPSQCSSAMRANLHTWSCEL